MAIWGVCDIVSISIMQRDYTTCVHSACILQRWLGNKHPSLLCLLPNPLSLINHCGGEFFSGGVHSTTPGPEKAWWSIQNLFMAAPNWMVFVRGMGVYMAIWLLTEFFATWFSRPNSLFSFDISLATDLKPQFSVWKITFRTWELTAIFRGSRLPFPGKIGHPRILLLIIIPPVHQQKMWYPPSLVKPTTMSIDWGRPRKKRQTQVILYIIYPITSSFYPHSP